MAYDVSAYADAFFSVSTQMQNQRVGLANYAIRKAAEYLQGNKTDEAITEFKKALAFDPANTTALKYIGDLNLSQGKTYEAQKYYKDLVRVQPDSVTAHVSLGNAYLQDKKYADSEKEYKFAARLDPLNPLPNYTLGHQYLQTDRVEEAEALFLKVQKISPKDGNVYYSLGSVYNEQGKYEDAVKNLQKALKLKSNFPTANYELGIAYNGLGQTDKAQEQLSILRKKDASLAKDLEFTLNKPKILSMDTTKSGGFVELFGPGTPLWALDPSLIDPDTTKKFSVMFQFTNEMDIASVVNPLNWSISRGNTAASGYYNNTMPVKSTEVSIPKIPLSVTYDATKLQATISFRISQNSTGDATIDPQHLVFKFAGKDAAGRVMDPTGDEIDGYALKSF
jgi:tetratricopeptide (TPR) repeat protein